MCLTFLIGFCTHACLPWLAKGDVVIIIIALNWSKKTNLGTPDPWVTEWAVGCFQVLTAQLTFLHFHNLRRDLAPCHKTVLFCHGFVYGLVYVQQQTPALLLSPARDLRPRAYVTIMVTAPLSTPVLYNLKSRKAVRGSFLDWHSQDRTQLKQIKAHVHCIIQWPMWWKGNGSVPVCCHHRFWFCIFCH